MLRMMTSSPFPILAAVGFVTPAFFVAGLALVGIPILIHILNRRRFKTEPWAAMEFLLRAMRKNRRRIRFEQWLLLAVRCAVLLLAATALARPYGCGDTTIASIAGARSGLHVFVIDNSYSMGYQADRPGARTHLEHAQALAKQQIERLNAGGESVAIITAARPATAVVAAPTYDLDAARATIDRIDLTAGGTDLAGALQKALEIGRDASTQPRRTLYLLTDATKSAWDNPRDAAALRQAGPDLAALFRVAHFNLGRANQWNQAVLALRPSSNLVTRWGSNDFTAEPKGFGQAAEATLVWRLDGASIPGRGTARLTVDAATPGQTLSNVTFPDGGPHVVTAALESDDRLDVDDARHRVVNVASELKVLIVEGERGMRRMGGSGAFLELALAPPAAADATNASGAKTSSYVAPELISDLELGNKVLADYRAVILAGVGQLQPAQADQIRHFVDGGGALLMFMGEGVSADNYNSVLLPRKLLPGPLTKRVSSVSDRGYTFEFNPAGLLHPLLEAFKGQTDTGLDRAEIFTYWQIDVPQDTDLRVLNYLAPDGKPAGDAAITAHALGQGRVVFVSTSAGAESAGNDWTTLPARQAYVALVHELLAGSVNTNDRWLNLEVGEPLVIPPTVRLSTVPTLADPQQRDVPIDQATTDGGQPVYRSRPLTRPGVYALSTGGRSIPVAVNPPPDEADVTTVNDAAIRSALGDIDVALEADALPEEAAAVEQGDDYGWTMMLAVLLFVGMECFLAMQFGHYKR